MFRHLVRTSAVVAIIAQLSAPSALAGTGPTQLPLRDPGPPAFVTGAGARPVATDQTVAHWHGQFTDPTNGVTYGYNMVGAQDPRSADAGTTVVPVDIIPLRLSFADNGGFALDGNDDLGLTVASPIFQVADYSYTAHSTGGAGPLSSGNVGVQYEDAVMRSQFDKIGTAYHLMLGGPNILPTVSLSVPLGKGSAFINSRDVVYGIADYAWFIDRVTQLVGQLQLDPTHLPIFLTDDVLLGGPQWCCAGGFHDAAKRGAGRGLGALAGSGNEVLNTYIWTSYFRPGLYNSYVEFATDIHALSHEVAEWTADPFVDNLVDPAFVQTPYAYGCLNGLEVGDPVANIGFTLPGNPDTRLHATGMWHPEDETFLPWWSREDPNMTSQLMQSGVGRRYTFMGELNPYAIFRAPAPHC